MPQQITLFGTHVYENVLDCKGIGNIEKIRDQGGCKDVP